MPRRPIKDLEVLWRTAGADDPKQRAALLVSWDWKVQLRDDRHEIWEGPGGALVALQVEPVTPPRRLRNLQLDAIEADSQPGAAGGDVGEAEASSAGLVEDWAEEQKSNSGSAARAGHVDRGAALSAVPSAEGPGGEGPGASYKSPVLLFLAFRRAGRRTYAEAWELLTAWGFTGRETPRGHSVWNHTRGLTLIIPIERELNPCYKQLIINVVSRLHCPGDPPTP